MSRSLRSFHSVGMTCRGWYRSPAQVVFVTFYGDESSPLHCVVPFTHTGYLRNVAGGRLPPLRFRCLANVFNQRISKTDTSVAPITVNCPLSTLARSGLLQQVLILLKRIHHALHHRAPEASRFQGFDAHDGAAAGGADGVFQGAGVLAGGQKHFRGTG